MGFNKTASPICVMRFNLVDDRIANTDMQILNVWSPDTAFQTLAQRASLSGQGYDGSMSLLPLLLHR
jgi:hypothetical protein